MTGIPLWIAEPTGRYERRLRRYTFSPDSACPGGAGHTASAVTGTVGEDEHQPVTGDLHPHDDPRWPGTCEHCGYAFTDADQWQLSDKTIYRLPDGTEFTFSRSLGMCAPPGTMIRAGWFDEHAAVPGESWLIALPDGGDWITTQRAAGGGHWTVTGTAPDITATPSVWHNSPNGWHGWVRNGELVPA